jgi:tricorn protease
MKKTYTFILLFLVLMSGFAINPKDTRMLSQPAVSNRNIAFIYAEDLWIANADGSQPKRLTIDEGVESNPFFSPDGSLIAFSAQYDGNTDVFIMPVEGGVPTRLTWHPGTDQARGFTPDGKNVLFISQRASFTNRYNQLFTVPITGGFPVQLEVPNAFNASYSPDGKNIAYNPISDAFRQWKNYRGGSVSVIWVFSFQDKSVIKIPQPEGGCNDSGPMWMGDRIYFRSDRNGEFNVFSYDVASKEVKQLTDFKDFPVINMTTGNNKVIFDQAGYLHTLDASATSSKRITVGIATDLLELRSRFVKGGNYIRSAAISPSGLRAVFDYRGDIVTVPAEKGDARNLTLTTGAHEKYPEWSPDGKSIAYFSDASGEYELHIKSQDGKGDTKAFKLGGTGFYAFTRWSPDSKKISYVDNGRNLYVIDVTTSVVKKIDSDEIYIPGPFRYQFGDWSRDSKWIAYSKVLGTQFNKIFLYSIDQNKSFPVTDGLSNATEPTFDLNGKYLFFFASTDAGPVVNWFDQSNNDMRSNSSIYLVTLQKETISPFAKENDEEEIKADKPDAAKTEDKSKDKKATTEPEKKTEAMRIDFDGIQNRTIDFPIKAGNYGNLGMAIDGELLYISYSNDGNGTLHKYDMKKRKDSDVMELDNYRISANGKKTALQ